MRRPKRRFRRSGAACEETDGDDADDRADRGAGAKGRRDYQKEAQTEIRAIHDKSDSEVDVVRMKTRGEMRAFLAPEQLPKFEQYIQRLDEERKKQKEAQGGTVG